jgi:hypothetical protein
MTHSFKRDHGDLDGNMLLEIDSGSNAVEAVETAL